MKLEKVHGNLFCESILNTQKQLDVSILNILYLISRFEMHESNVLTIERDF